MTPIHLSLRDTANRMYSVLYCYPTDSSLSPPFNPLCPIPFREFAPINSVALGSRLSYALSKESRVNSGLQVAPLKIQDRAGNRISPSPFVYPRRV